MERFSLKKKIPKKVVIWKEKLKKKKWGTAIKSFVSRSINLDIVQKSFTLIALKNFVISDFEIYIKH